MRSGVAGPVTAVSMRSLTDPASEFNAAVLASNGDDLAGLQAARGVQGSSREDYISGT